MSSDHLDTLPAVLSSLQDKHYRLIFEAAGVGIALIDRQGCFLDVNQRYADICQRERHQLIGLDWACLTHPEDASAHRALVKASLNGRRLHFSLDLRCVSPAGHAIWTQTNTLLIRDPQGQPRHFVSVAEDISERKRYQETLLTAEAAARASKAKTEFLSRMSHELRTPLNAMLGFAQLLRLDTSHPLHPDQQQKVSRIEQAGAHLLATLTDVLDLSRIEAGHLPLSPETLVLHETLHEAIKVVQHLADVRGITIHMGHVARDWRIHADRQRWQQVLIQLLSNAIKYNRQQGQVWVSAAWHQPCVQVCIEDSGPGLSKDQQAHLFEPFNRLGAERTDIEGTGIGLVIVRKLLHLMQGDIRVLSEAGHGTTFHVTLPLHEVEEHASDTHGESSAAPSSAPEADLTLLYAEDNPVNVELLRHVMSMRPRWRLQVSTCGAEAIEMALANPPDLLLLDMHLGDMTGLDVSDALVTHPGLADIPRVALSADVMPDQIKAAKDRQFLDYLTKPLEIAQLFRLLDAHERNAPLPARH